MLRPSLIACSECACHVRADEDECPHCGAPLRTAPSTTDARSFKRAAIAVSLGLVVSVAALAACDDTSGSGGAGGSDTSAIATYGVGSTASSTGAN